MSVLFLSVLQGCSQCVYCFCLCSRGVLNECTVSVCAPGVFSMSVLFLSVFQGCSQ